ncbi:hypothetical protein [uncultured Erythrobacter sp.]|uniref:hypothetical protein n=1 Tax=uncultured Erythrobacter sp. TaxID=263913 RepID=UPI00262566E4|nr:hypothetical protein [uncultured Erythrobacter sp.]
MWPFILPGALLASAAACAGPGETVPVLYTYDDVISGAQLRAEAGVVIGAIFNPCGTTPAMQPTIDRFELFVESLPAEAQKLDMAIARADYDYQMSLVDIACPDFTEQETLEYEKLEISVANSVLDRMDRLVTPVSGQDK